MRFVFSVVVIVSQYRATNVMYTIKSSFLCGFGINIYSKNNQYIAELLLIVALSWLNEGHYAGGITRLLKNKIAHLVVNKYIAWGTVGIDFG